MEYAGEPVGATKQFSRRAALAVWVSFPFRVSASPLGSAGVEIHLSAPQFPL